MTKALELRELEDTELDMRLDESKKELFNLRFQSVTGKLDSYTRLRELRHEIARIATVIREREIADMEGRQADARPHHTELRPSKYGPGTLTIDHSARSRKGSSDGQLAEDSTDGAEDSTDEFDESQDGEADDASKANVELSPASPSSITESTSDSTSNSPSSITESTSDSTSQEGEDK